MKVYNEDKTKILSDYDLTKGKLVEDKIIIHHEAVNGVEEQGHYKVIAEYPNGGKDVEWVVDVKGVETKEAYDEEERIYIYKPFTEEEKKNILRSKRERMLIAFDKYKSSVNYGIITETTEERQAVIEWYNKLLNLDEATIENVDLVPNKIKYYL